MPAPAVYVVAVVGTVAVCFVVKKFIIDPWLDGSGSGAGAGAGGGRRSRRRQPVPPHTTHEAELAREAPSTHEMRDLGMSSGSSCGVFPPSTGLRNRRSNAGASKIDDSTAPEPKPMDAHAGDDIPYTPLVPEPNPWKNVQSSCSWAHSRPSSPSAVQSPFELGSESATLPSLSPRIDDISLDESPRSSPHIAPSPRIQLPTPSDSGSEDNMMAGPPSPETHPDLLQWTKVVSAASRIEESTAPTSDSQSRQAQTLSPDPHPDLHALSMSRTVTDTSASFMTAQSPSTEFRSFPPSEVTSPFSETFALSGDEDMYSIPSHTSSTDSLPVFAPPESDRHDGLTFVVGGSTEHNETNHSEGSDDFLSDHSGDGGSSGDFSDESWSEFGETLLGATNERS